jgi:hypothetical protein
MKLNRPVPFNGSAEEARANFASHNWYWDDGDGRCMVCDAHAGMSMSYWPCGTVVPRETIEVGAFPVAGPRALALDSKPDYTHGDLDDDARADAVVRDAYEHGFDREGDR